MTKEDIHIICYKYKITNYTINDDLSIDVDGDVNLRYRNLIELPLKFRNVTGNFNCMWNSLTSLEGGPSFVGGHYYCNINKLLSLEGSPSKVGGYFDCSNNNLTSLDGAPSYVEGRFDCSLNPLESLKGIPLELSEKQLYLPKDFTYNDYLEYCKVVERDLKFKKILNYK